jgi:hypothetical protein
MCNPNVFRLGQLTGLILPSLQVSTVSFKVIQLGAYGLGSPPLLQLEGLYTGHSASPTAGSIFETPALWYFIAAGLVSRFVLHQLVCISLISATNGFEIVLLFLVLCAVVPIFRALQVLKASTLACSVTPYKVSQVGSVHGVARYIKIHNR